MFRQMTPLALFAFYFGMHGLTVWQNAWGSSRACITIACIFGNAIMPRFKKVGWLYLA
jgi:hypothetical protein